MLLLKRMHQRASVFGALLVVVALGSGLSAGIVEMFDGAETAGVRAQLATRTGADTVLELSLRSESDSPAQDDRVHALLARVFADGRRTLPISVTRSIVSDNPVPLSLGVKAFVASVPQLESHADLVDGEWPRTDAEATVQADAAQALGIAAGDELEVGDTRVIITGTWRVSDPLDPRWVSDTLLLDGHRGVVLGPIVLAENQLPAVSALTTTRWAIAPQSETFEAGDLNRFIEAWDAIDDSLRSDGGFNVNSLHRGGRFDSVATSIQSNVNALGAVAPVALLVIAALVVLTTVELARLLGIVRGAEYRLFWSRGDSIIALSSAGALEAAVVALIGAVLGTGVGSVIAGRRIEELGVVEWIAPAVSVVIAAVVFGAGAFTATRVAISNDETRSVRVAGIAAPILLAIGAVIATWQLLLYGSPLSPTRDGGAQVDPIAVLSAPLCLLALVAIAVAVLPIAGPLIDRAAERSAGRALVSRTLARRPRTFAAAFVLCALATGQLTIAAAYAQTWDAAYETASAVRAGSDLTIEDAHSALSEGVLDNVRAAPGVDTVAPVYSEPVEVGATLASMVALTPGALTSLGTPANGQFDPTAAAKQIALPVTGPMIPSGTREVAVTVTSDVSVPVGLTLVVADELGAQREIAATGSYRFELPAGNGQWKVLAFIVELPDDGPTALAVTTIVADGVAVDMGGGWTAAGFDPLRAPVTRDPTAAGFLDAFGLESVRLTPLFGNLTDDIRPRVLISRELATTARVRVGDTVPVALDERSEPFAVVVAGIVPAIPGAASEAAVLIDGSLVAAVRARFYETTPTPQVAWIGSADPAVDLGGVRRAVPAGVLVSALAVDANREMVAAVAHALWLGAAGAGLLSFIAVGASAAVQVRARRGETLIVRALGVSDRDIATGRRAELAIVLGVGLLIGLASGLIVSVLTVPLLARAAVPGSYAAIATPLGIHPVGLVTGLVVLAAGFSVALFLYGRSLIRPLSLRQKALE